MSKTIASALLVLGLTLAGAADAQPVSWKYDAAHSTVGFTVRHLGISKVRGRFAKTDGVEVMADPKTGRLSSVKATVPVASVETGIAKRDEHLRAPDFFDANKFPTMTFVSTAVKFTGDQVEVRGDLTIKGNTRSVVFKGEYLGVSKVNFGGGDQLRAGYSLATEIDRKEFGLSFGGMAEGVAMVSDKVRIELEVELAAPAAAAM